MRAAGQKLRDQAGSPANFEFLGQDAQSGIGSDEVHSLYAIISRKRKQKLAQKNRAAGSGGGDGQILWPTILQRLLCQSCSSAGGDGRWKLEHRELQKPSQAGADPNDSNSAENDSANRSKRIAGDK